MKKRILIISRNGNPMPPRTQMILDVLGLSYDVDLIDVKPTENWTRRINYLSLYYFDLVNNHRLVSKLKDYDAIMIKDLQFLPLAKQAKKMGKYVIYETLDFNPQLRFYGLSSQFPFMKKMEWIKTKAETLEKKLVNKYVDRLLVNSDALNMHFNQDAIINYYSSPFENIDMNNNANRPSALLYLGHFSLEKGGAEMLDYQEKLNLPLYIFGGIDNKELSQRVSKNKAIKHFERIPATQLAEELKLILNKYFLFGFSIIHDANESYAVQNANKDIDYLAMGIPLIGNHRKTTEEIILDGCGVFIEDAENIKSFDADEKESLRVKCNALYQSTYSNKQFKKNLLQAFDGI